MSDAPCHWTHRHDRHEWTPILADLETPGVLHVGVKIWCPGKDASGNPLTDLLEDMDGAPYPEEVQAFVRALVSELDEDAPHRLGLVEALESVSKFEEQDQQIDLLLGRLEKVKKYLTRCAIMRVEPSTQGLTEALTYE